MTCPLLLMQERFLKEFIRSSPSIRSQATRGSQSGRLFGGDRSNLISYTECIKALVEFSYSGELTFTTHNFAKMKQAIRELKMKNIDEESLSKIEEDIEQSNERIQMPLRPLQTPH